MPINASVLAAQFQQRSIDRSYQPAIRPYNYISSVGEECARKLYYFRTAGDRAEPLSPEIMEVLEQGIEDEKLIKRQVIELGYEWHEEQAAVAFADLELRGKHEGFIVKDGEKCPSEIKSIDKNLFYNLGPLESLKEHHIFRKYLLQFMTYLRGLEKDFGVMIFAYRNHKRIYDVPFDYDFWKEVPEKLKLVNAAVAKGEPPERIEGRGDDKICSRCPFAHICLPDIKNERGIIFLDDNIVEGNLDRMEELKPFVSEYRSLEKWRRERLRNVNGAVCGKYLINGKTVDRMGYTVEPTSYWKSNIIKVDK